MLSKPAFERLPKERKRQIIEQAMDLYLSVPFEQVTIRKLVEHLKINMNTFYRYFDSKDDLYLYICSDLNKRLIPNYEEEKLLSGFQEIPKSMTEKENAFLMQFWGLPDEMLHRLYFEVYLDFRELYGKALKQKKEEGLLREDVDIDLISYMYVTAGYNLFLYFKKTGKTRAEWSQLKEYFFYHFFNYGIIGKQ